MRLGIPRNGLTGYAMAVVSTAVATWATWWLTPDLVGVSPLFFAAVMLSAWYGGLGPGLLATALSGFCTAYFFLGSPRSLLSGVDDAVRIVMFVAVAVLISSLHARTQESEQEARRAQAEAVAANRAKDRFLAVVSHELRNPLNPVLTIASAWEQDPSLPDDLRADWAMVRRNIQLEARLIEDLLDLSRITAGKLELRRQPVDLRHVIRDARAVCDHDAEQKQLAVDVDLPDEGLTVDGDPARLRQIVWNLLTNAVKFTPPGGRIVVTVSADATRSPGAVEIAVTDTGAGMDPATLAGVFEAFEQGGRDVTQRYGGLGLGLAITKALTEAHGGTVTAHSDGPGRGARFVVRLPLASPRPAAESPEPKSSSPNLSAPAVVASEGAGAR